MAGMFGAIAILLVVANVARWRRGEPLPPAPDPYGPPQPGHWAFAALMLTVCAALVVAGVLDLRDGDSDGSLLASGVVLLLVVLGLTVGLLRRWRRSR